MQSQSQTPITGVECRPLPDVDAEHIPGMPPINTPPLPTTPSSISVPMKSSLSLPLRDLGQGPPPTQKGSVLVSHIRAASLSSNRTHSGHDRSHSQDQNQSPMIRHHPYNQDARPPTVHRTSTPGPSLTVGTGSRPRTPGLRPQTPRSATMPTTRQPTGSIVVESNPMDTPLAPRPEGPAWYPLNPQPQSVYQPALQPGYIQAAMGHQIFTSNGMPPTPTSTGDSGLMSTMPVEAQQRQHLQPLQEQPQPVTHVQNHRPLTPAAPFARTSKPSDGIIASHTLVQQQQPQQAQQAQQLQQPQQAQQQQQHQQQPIPHDPRRSATPGPSHILNHHHHPPPQYAPHTAFDDPHLQCQLTYQGLQTMYNNLGTIYARLKHEYGQLASGRNPAAEATISDLQSENHQLQSTLRSVKASMQRKQARIVSSSVVQPAQTELETLREDNCDLAAKNVELEGQCLARQQIIDSRLANNAIAKQRTDPDSDSAKQGNTIALLARQLKGQILASKAEESRATEAELTVTQIRRALADSQAARKVYSDGLDQQTAKLSRANEQINRQTSEIEQLQATSGDLREPENSSRIRSHRHNIKRPPLRQLTIRSRDQYRPTRANSQPGGTHMWIH